MRCFWYAVCKEWREGGYVAVRRVRIKGLGWLPHFSHATRIEGVSQMSGTTNEVWWKELWYVVTGQHYKIKYDD